MSIEPVAAKCEVQIANPPVTVGDPFTLSCQGNFGAGFSSTTQIVPVDEKNKYTLKILGVKSASPGDAQFTVTSYKAGDFKDQVFIISDGLVNAKTDPLAWSVKSVLEQDSKPFPPMGPMKMSYPNAVWLVILLILAAISLIVWQRLNRRRARRNLIEGVLGAGREGVPFRELVKIQNTQAFSQFSRDLRQVQKDMNAMKPKPADEIWAELEKAFRLYLVRELLTPAFDWSQRQILNDIKKNHRKVYNRCSAQLRRGLSEFEKGKGQKVTLSDCEQMYVLTRQIADEVYEARRKVAK